METTLVHKWLVLGYIVALEQRATVRRGIVSFVHRYIPKPVTECTKTSMLIKVKGPVAKPTDHFNGPPLT